MFRCIALSLTLLAGATAPLAAQPDRAYSLIGTWSCSSSGSTGTITYVRNADGSISMKNVFVLANTGAHGEFDEQYRFDPATAVWTWTAEQPSMAAFQERGTAGPWTAQNWIFDGSLKLVPASRTFDSLSEPTPMTEQAVRMVYTSLGGDVFRRDFESYQNGLWVVRSSGTCKRAPRGGG